MPDVSAAYTLLLVASGGLGITLLGLVIDAWVNH
jgi:hypothetical protein